MTLGWLVRPTRLMISGLLLSGCAIKTPHLAINQFPIQQKAMYFGESLPYRVLVLPFTDVRPQEERQGKKAPAMFLVLWNKRVGDYCTSDRVFGQNVPAQLSEQLAQYLRASHLFAEVLPPPDPSSPDWTSAAGLRQLATQHMIDFFISGEVQHFYGSQHQHFSMYVLPLYFVSAAGWQNGKSLPWGKTAIRYTVLEGSSGDLVWAQVIGADSTLPRETDSMAEAAMESFVNAAGQLTTQLRQLPLDAWGSERRESREAL